MTLVLAGAFGVVGLILAPLGADLATALGRRLLARRVAARGARSHLAALAANVELLGSAAKQADGKVPDDVRELVDRLRLLVMEGDASLAAQPPFAPAMALPGGAPNGQQGGAR
jgi:hypothetical protein